QAQQPQPAQTGGAEPGSETPGPQAAPQFGGGGGGGGGFGGGGRGPRVPPGEYTVKVSPAGEEASTTARAQEDPRIHMSEADRAKWSEALMKAYELQRSAAAAQRSAQNLRTQITTLQESLRRTPSVTKEVNDAVKSLSDGVDNVSRRLTPAFDPSGSAGPPLPDAPRPVLG